MTDDIVTKALSQGCTFTIQTAGNDPVIIVRHGYSKLFVQIGLGELSLLSIAEQLERAAQRANEMIEQDEGA